jgi:hypothetical protein
MNARARLVILCMVLTGVGAVMAPATPAAHGGGLDKYGCHNDRKNGGYQCHRGPCAGQSFQSQAQMLAAQCSKR